MSKAVASAEQKLQSLAQVSTTILALSGISSSDALLVVLNMLLYHSRLVMSKQEHKAFFAGLSELLQAAQLPGLE